MFRQSRFFVAVTRGEGMAVEPFEATVIEVLADGMVRIAELPDMAISVESVFGTETEVREAFAPREVEEGNPLPASGTPPISQSETRGELESGAEAEAEDIRTEEADEPQPIGRGVFGNIYDAFKGKVKEAVNFLLMRKEGEAVDVFFRNEIGPISLIWGNEKQGLQHIIQKHVEQYSDFADVEEAVSTIERLVTTAPYRFESGGRQVVFDDGTYKVVVAQSENGRWVVTAYDNSRPPEEKRNGGSDEKVLGHQPDVNNNGSSPLYDETATSGGEVSNISSDMQATPLDLSGVAAGDVIHYGADGYSGSYEVTRIDSEGTVWIRNVKGGDEQAVPEEDSSDFYGSLDDAIDVATGVKVKTRGGLESGASGTSGTTPIDNVARGVTGTPAADGGVSGSPLSAEETPSGIPLDGNGEPMYESVEVAVALDDLLNNQGLTADEAAAYVANRHADAQARYDELQANPPKMGSSVAEYRGAKERWQSEVGAAEDSLKFWGSADAEMRERMAVAETEPTSEPIAEEADEPQPIGRGVFGNIYDAFKGKVKEAVAFLLGKKDGEAIGALHHNEIGEISLVYGTDGYGLLHIANKHPEILNDLQGVISGMEVVSQSDNRIVLESPTHRAVVSKMLGNEATDNWLLTAYEKKSPVSASSSDIETEPVGMQNGTAPLQNETSGGEVSENVSDVQGENGGVDVNTQISADVINGIEDTETLIGLLAEIDARLSDFTERDAIRAEETAVREQYGSLENAPAEVQEALRNRWQSYNANTRTLYDNKYAIQDRIRAIEEAQAEAERQDAIAQEMARQATAYNGFLVGMTPMARGRAEKTLSKKQKYGGKVMTRAEFIERGVAEGREFSIGEWKGKTEYRVSADVGFYTITKLEYDYAQYLKQLAQNNAAATSEATASDARELATAAADVSDDNADGASQAGQDGEVAEGLTDSQGNPVGAEGRLVLEEITSIDQLTDEDFTRPTRSVRLPALPGNVDNAIGANGKPVIIKKNIFEKNAKAHKDLSPDDSRLILAEALYAPNLYGQTQPVSRLTYWVAIKTADKNKVVVLEVNNNKDNVEVVGWRYAGERQLEELKRQAEREDGQLLILTSNNEAAAGLSTLPSGLSEGEVTQTSADTQAPTTQKPINNLSELRAKALERGADAKRLDRYDQMPLTTLRKQARNYEAALRRITDDAVRAEYDYVRALIAEQERNKKNNKWGVKVGNTATPFEVVRAMFEEWNSDEDLAALFAKVAPIFEKLPVTILFSDTIGGKGTQGSYKAAKGELKLPGHFVYSDVMSNQEKAQTILHEMIHAVTSYALYVDEKPALQSVIGMSLSSEMRKAVDALRLIFGKIKNDADFKGYYGATDVHEMVAELANPKFRAKLREKGLWQQIVDAIKRLLGIEVKNALDGAEGALQKMLDNFDRSQWDKLVAVGRSDANMADRFVDRMIIGEQGATELDKAEEVTHRMDNLGVAREMEAEGKDTKAIRMATGWERGADGKWRYEIEDVKLIAGWEKEADRVTGVRLSKVIDNKKLLDAYPELADVYVSRE